MIPSLVELCLMSSKGLLWESNSLCKAFRKLYCDIFAETTFHKDQLKWLFYLLSCLEQEEEKLENTTNNEPTCNWVHHTDHGLGDKTVFLRSCRNIWSPALYMKRYSKRLLQSLEDTYSHMTLTACLPHNVLMSMVTSDQDYVNNYLCSFYGLSGKLLTVVGSYILLNVEWLPMRQLSIRIKMTQQCADFAYYTLTTNVLKR